MYVALSGGILLISVMSQQLLSNGTVHNFLKNLTFHQNVSSLFFYMYHRAEMDVHAFMNELDRKDY